MYAHIAVHSRIAMTQKLKDLSLTFSPEYECVCRQLMHRNLYPLHGPALVYMMPTCHTHTFLQGSFVG